MDYNVQTTTEYLNNLTTMDTIIKTIIRLSNIWRYNCVGGKELSTQTRCINIYKNLSGLWESNTSISRIIGSRVVAAKKLAILYSMDSEELKFADNNVERYLEDKIINEIKDPRFDILLATQVEKNIISLLNGSYIKAYAIELMKINAILMHTKLAVILITALMGYRFWDMNIQFLGLPTLLCFSIFILCLAEIHDDLNKKWNESLKDMRGKYSLISCETVEGWKTLVERDKLISEVEIRPSKNKIISL